MFQKIGKAAFSVLLSIAAILIACGTALASNVSGTKVYGDMTDNRCFYERMVELPNGDLLATW